MTLQERLRRFHRRRRTNRPVGPTSPRVAARGPSVSSDVAASTAHPRSVGNASSDGQWAPNRNPVGSRDGVDGTVNPPPSSDSVYVPTHQPDEVVTPSETLEETSAQIPEVVPSRPTGRNPWDLGTPVERNLLPPPREPQPRDLSTWQRLKKRYGQSRSINFKQSFSRGTWLFGGTNDVGMFDIYTQATFEFPKLPGVTMTPSFQAYFFDGPIRTDLPARVYGIQAEFRSLLPVSKKYVLDLAISPGVFSDFEQGDSDSFRLQGRALGMYLHSEQSRFLLGVMYLDRDDVNVLPAGGWIYAPRDDLLFEILFPRPKIAKRISVAGTSQRWVYVAGEFGGDSWSVERTTGANDRLVYRDLRLIFGFEQRYVNGRALVLEVGYVFDRRVEFESDRGDFDPSSTGMLRGGLVY